MVYTLAHSSTSTRTTQSHRARRPKSTRRIPLFRYVTVLLCFVHCSLGLANLLTCIFQARNHGNEPSKGAKIDAELQQEEEEILKKKGAWGSKQ